MPDRQPSLLIVPVPILIAHAFRLNRFPSPRSRQPQKVATKKSSPCLVQTHAELCTRYISSLKTISESTRCITGRIRSRPNEIRLRYQENSHAVSALQF